MSTLCISLYDPHLTLIIFARKCQPSPTIEQLISQHTVAYPVGCLLRYCFRSSIGQIQRVAEQHPANCHSPVME